jgi:hypothetical protein
MKTALVIIDLQQGSFTAAVPKYDADGLVTRLNVLAGAVRAIGGRSSSFSMTDRRAIRIVPISRGGGCCPR